MNVDQKTAEKIESHLASIAECLRVIAGAMPGRWERMAEATHAALLVNAGHNPSPLRAAELATELEALVRQATADGAR